MDKGKYLLLQFVFPDTGKRSAKPCNVKFTEEGIIMAIAKAHKVVEALKKFSTSSEFWLWYDKEILEKNEIENDLKTYREIFKKIEDKYFNGVHFKAISDRTNKDMLLVLGDRTYFGVTVKTGNRICVPMIPDLVL